MHAIFAFLEKQWRKDRTLIAIGVCLSVFLGAKMIAKHIDLEGDAGMYISAAVGVLEGTDLYAKNLKVEGAMYPPLLPIILAPAVRIEPRVGLVFWALLSLAATVASAILLAGCVEDRGRRWRLILTVMPALLAFRFLDSNFGNGQANSLILFSFSLACWALSRKRAWLAGLAIGFGIATKLVVVGLLGYLVLRRRWKAALASVAFTLLLGGLLPVAVLGAERTATTYKNFYQTMRAFSGSWGYDLDAPDRGYVPGQTLRPMAFRFLRPTQIGLSKRRGAGIFVNFTNVSGETAEAFYKGAALLVMALGAGLWFVGRDRVPNRVLFDLSVAALVLVIAAPYARKAYFVVLMLPFTYVLNELYGMPGRDALRGVGLGLLGWGGLLLVTGIFGVTPPTAPLLAIAAAAVGMGLLSGRNRVVFGLTYTSAITALTARDLVGSWLTYRMLGFCVVGLSAIFLLVLLALMTRPKPGDERAAAPTPD